MAAPCAERRSVWVTGAGVYASSGSGSRFWSGLLEAPQAGHSRVVEADLDLADLLDVKQLRRFRRHSALGVAAARDALIHAGIGDALPVDTAVVVGNAMGDMGQVVEESETLRAGYVNRLSSVFAAQFVPNAPAAAISLVFGLRGHCEGITTACASATHAILSASRLIAHGYADVAIAGGAESPLFAALHAGLLHAGVLAPDGVLRPFDRDRSGFVLSEGAAMLVLESEEHARARGARPLARVVGGAVRNEAFHLIAQRRDGSGAADCMQAALADACLDSGEIAAVSAHGTGTVSNDLTEALGLAATFPAVPPVIAVKGATAHCAGASGAIEVAVALECMARRTLPPTQGLRDIDDAIGVDVVTRERPWTPGPVLLNSFGLGGHSTSVVVSPVELPANG